MQGFGMADRGYRMREHESMAIARGFNRNYPAVVNSCYYDLEFPN
jgi:hypothetical protein